MSNIYKPGQILYIKPEYGDAYIKILEEYDNYEKDEY